MRLQALLTLTKVSKILCVVSLIPGMVAFVYIALGIVPDSSKHLIVGIGLAFLIPGMALGWVYDWLKPRVDLIPEKLRHT